MTAPAWVYACALQLYIRAGGREVAEDDGRWRWRPITEEERRRLHAWAEAEGLTVDPPSSSGAP